MSRTDRVLELVEAAQSLPAAERGSWLAAECGNDDELRREVEELLALEVEDDEQEVAFLPGDAAHFIDRFKQEVARATLHAEAHVRHQELFDKLLEDLLERGARPERYRLKELLGQGGMGEVHAAWDEVLHRHVALKRVRPLEDGSAPPAGSQIRFLQEAQVTGQLDHPGVPNVYELGVQDGLLFFTMPLVRGQGLSTVLAEMPEGQHAWEHRRILDTVLQAARTIAHAHDRGIVHRDLKPANVMTSRFGAAVVMDWGIARVVDEDHARELLFGGEPPEEVLNSGTTITGRAFETVVGGAMGTPSYMPPEQARAETVGPAADVYALGAILYEVLAGTAPYLDQAGEEGELPTASEVTRRAAQQAPTPLGILAPGAPGELVAIAERAMQREPSARFPGVLDLVEDLENYLSGRVVQSYETGLLPETRKWIARNPLLAMMALLVVLTLVGGVTTALVLQNKREAETSEKLDKIRRLYVIQDADRLLRDLETLWPDQGASLEALTTWRTEALNLADHLPSFESELDVVLAEAGRDDRGELMFETDQERWWHYQVAETIAKLSIFLDETAGPVYGTSKEHGPGVETRIEFARARLERLADAEFLARWDQANADVAAAGVYGDIVLTPDSELLPLGLNPNSGLCEFLHIESGIEPERRDDGHWHVAPETGIVFVLIPGGGTWIGSQKDDPDQPNQSRQSAQRERPVHEVQLEPYLIAAHELTTGQFERLAGYLGGTIEAEGGTLPVDSVNWWEAKHVLERRGLHLPSESQWERAARGGTEGGFYVEGQMPEDIVPHELILFRRVRDEAYAAYVEKYGGEIPEVPSGPRAVDLGTANPYGLFNVLGNLREWCEDMPASYETPATGPRGMRAPDDPLSYVRMARGGNFEQSPWFARVSRRQPQEGDLRARRLGVRAARSLR